MPFAKLIATPGVAAPNDWKCGKVYEIDTPVIVAKAKAKYPFASPGDQKDEYHWAVCETGEVEGLLKIYLGKALWQLLPDKKDSRCECGAAKCGAPSQSPMHSTWCPEYAMFKQTTQSEVEKCRAAIKQANIFVRQGGGFP